MSKNKSMILALTDGKPGHETQTQGLIQLLNYSNEYNVEWLTVQFPSKWHYKILRFLLKLSGNTNWLKYFFNQEQLELTHKLPIRYIVSAGGNTLIANALLKVFLAQHQKVQNVVASSLRGIPAKYFDAVFTIHPEQKYLAHYVYYPIAPNKMVVNPLTQDQARKNLAIGDAEQIISVLIGADTKKVKIGSAQKWGKVLLTIRRQYPNAHILLTTSRRSSKEFELELHDYIHQHQIFSLENDKSVWVAQGQYCDVKDFIKAADWVLVSPDSTSMVAEVIMAEKKLVVLEADMMNDSEIYNQLQNLRDHRQLAEWKNNSSEELSVILKNIVLEPHAQLCYSALFHQLDKS